MPCHPAGVKHPQSSPSTAVSQADGMPLANVTQSLEARPTAQMMNVIVGIQGTVDANNMSKRVTGTAL